jgi:hypothetical protein
MEWVERFLTLYYRLLDRQDQKSILLIANSEESLCLLFDKLFETKKEISFEVFLFIVK